MSVLLHVSASPSDPASHSGKAGQAPIAKFGEIADMQITERVLSGEHRAARGPLGYSDSTRSVFGRGSIRRLLHLHLLDN
jgi:hypothetical protein